MLILHGKLCGVLTTLLRLFDFTLIPSRALLSDAVYSGLTWAEIVIVSFLSYTFLRKVLWYKMGQISEWHGVFGIVWIAIHHSYLKLNTNHLNKH